MAGKYKGNLSYAHSGYRYQDLITAYLLSESLIHHYVSITIDKKVVDNDKFDDIEVISDSLHVRRQIKYSKDSSRCLQEDDFVGEGSSLRIDYLVQSYLQSDHDTANEYRLCATWKIPQEERLLSYLEPIDVSATVSSYPSKFFRLAVDLIWPSNGRAVWARLDNEMFSREKVMGFCERFIIELELPTMSSNLNVPGPLEGILVNQLTDRIGIGKYPNQDRRSEDVAALLIDTATSARAQKTTLTPRNIEDLIELRTDYGRIAQAFSLDKSIFQDRQVLRPVLFEAALQGKHQILTGSPGSGKSWELTKLAEDLKTSGAIVARHYCYLEPGDELVERRITTDAMFGNIMAEIIDEEQSLRNKVQHRYSAGHKELEDLLEQAAQLGKPVIIIIDGLDHITRIREEARSISRDETDIVEQLATLKVPKGVSLIFGSQPGIHLNPFYQAFGEVIEYQVQPWSETDIIALSTKLGALSAIIKAGYQEPGATMKLLAQRSEGHPLYATYLSRELINRVLSGDTPNIEDWLQGTPVIAGNIERYYAYLYKHASNTTRSIADVIGLIDFGVSEGELREILPAPDKRFIPKAIEYLQPILTTISAQGGFRVFHESFRRFIAEELVRQGGAIEDTLQPVINWLQLKDFYQDAKAYRFLLPALRRANRSDEVFALIDTSFVSKSVTYGHPLAAIERNLALMADTAAQSLCWPELVRCAELNRSASTCFEEKLHDPLPYWETFLDLFGPNVLADRLLFDGRTTQESQLGLVLCSLVDDHNVTPPWREYLHEYEKLSRNSDDDRRRVTREHKWKQRVSIARIHGEIRLKGIDPVLNNILEFLVQRGERHVYPEYISALAERMTRCTNHEVISAIIAKANSTESSHGMLAPSVIILLMVGVANALNKSEDYRKLAEIVNSVIDNVKTPELAVVCLCLGGSPDKALVHAMPLSTLDLGFNKYIDEGNARQVRRWVASVRLFAIANEELLDQERERIYGSGWYRCWLRFVIAVAEVEAARRRGENFPTIRTAYNELVVDVRPFAGKPRPCDLYFIEELIIEVFSWSFSFLDTEEEWDEALRNIQIVIDSTSVSLQQESGSPINIEKLFRALIPYATHTGISTLIRSFIGSNIESSLKTGTYFEYHAEQSMMLARILNAAGDTAAAHSAWKQVGIYLCSYGFRKDTTIYEIIDSIPAIAKSDPKEGLKALIETQPLADAMIRYTDGRSTKRASLYWFHSLMKCNLTTSLALLFNSISTKQAGEGWLLEEALQDAIEEVSESADPIILEALYSTIPVEIESEEEAEDTVDKRLVVINRLCEYETQRGVDALQRLAAQVSGDGRSHKEQAINRVQLFAEQNNIQISPIPSAKNLYRNLEKKDHVFRHNRNSDELLHNTPYFPVRDTSVDLIAHIRQTASILPWDKERRDGFVNALGYRFITLISEGKEEEVIRLIRFTGRLYQNFDGSIHILADIAEGLERYGYIRVAAIAYGLAYAKTRGGRGWLTMGDAEHEHVLLRGVALGREDALRSIATEIAYLLQNISYPAGITRHLTERAGGWGEPHTARNCWWEAFKVIKHRIPIPVDTQATGWFEQLEIDQLPDWSVDEGLAALLLGRVNHPILYRKVSALAGVSQVITLRPDTMINPLCTYLRKDTPTSSILLILYLLLIHEDKPYTISQGIKDILETYSESEIWGHRILAKILLERIGISVPSYDQPMPNVQGLRLSPKGEDILEADIADRLDVLEQLWPDISQFVALRLDSLMRSCDIHKKRQQKRYEMLSDGEGMPSSPVLLWEYELFETALHETLNGLHLYLLVTGNWSQEINKEILGAVLPNVQAHIGVSASRIARPTYPDPQTSRNGKRDIPTISDPLYMDWRRIGYFERQWVHEENSHSSPLEALVSVFSGIILEPVDRGPEISGFPFSDADVFNWWYPQNILPHGPNFQLPFGPLAHLTRITDWLGDVFVLIPPIVILAYTEIHPPELGEPLIWKDKDGNPLVVFRSWRIRDEKQSGDEPRESEGCDLLVHPKIFSYIENFARTPLQELTIVER